MSQVQRHPSLPRLPGEKGSLDGGKRHLISVPPPPPTVPPHRRRRRTPWLTFGLGLALGYGLASGRPGVIPSLRTLASLVPAGSLASLESILTRTVRAPHALTDLLNPMAGRRVLVMGSDMVGDNTDVMLVVQVRNGITHLTQVPRDTFVETRDLGAVKANALYALGGPHTTRTEVSRLVNAPVDRYLKVNLRAVSRLADALGGVEVDVPKPMYYVDNSQGLVIDLQPGRQLLRGEQLEGFLRFRHDEMGDLGRMERQRLVMREVFRKLAGPAAVARLPALLRIAGEDVRTDLSPIEFTQLMTTMSSTRLSSQRLPGRLYWQDELSYWMPDSNRNHPTGNGAEPPI